MKAGAIARWGAIEDRLPYNIVQKELETSGINFICEKYNVSRGLIYRAFDKGLLLKVKRTKRAKHSDVTKFLISQKRKEFLKNNPDKHPWRSCQKFKSIPCEKLKEWLSSKNIQFVSEFQPEINGRHFSIDIAFPEKFIGIEVNGNQHYDKNGALKPYYAEREKLLEDAGWKIYQLHYSICFKLEKLEEFVAALASSRNKCEFKYDAYKKKIKPPKISDINPLWKNSPRPKTRKVERPSKELLEELVKTESLASIGRRYSVSCNAVRKWIKYYNRTLS